MVSKLAKELVILLCLKIMSDIITTTPSQWYLIDVLNSDDDHIDMPNLIKMIKLTKNVEKINSCLLVSYFTIHLFNSFFFIVLSSPHPYYDFKFIYL